jgi:hypothetical protein
MSVFAQSSKVDKESLTMAARWVDLKRFFSLKCCLRASFCALFRYLFDQLISCCSHSSQSTVEVPLEPVEPMQNDIISEIIECAYECIV